MTDAVNEPLKPCPWCNKPPQVEPWHGGPGQYQVSCAEASCPVNPQTTGETRVLAIMSWNTRAPFHHENLNVKDMERYLIITAFQRFDGNRTLMSKALGIAYRTLCGKLRALGYEPREKPDVMSP